MTPASAAVIRNPLAALSEAEPEQAPAPPPAEHVRDNHLWAHASPRISICVPVYKFDVAPLMAALSWCIGSALAELVVYDDGSAVPGMLSWLEQAAFNAAIPVRIVAGETNIGRAAARNRAIAHARADWILLLDADMWPDTAGFIQEYVAASEAAGRPALIVGGYSLKQASTEPKYKLHRWQALRSECEPSAVRRQAPGRFVFTSNVLAHRKVLEQCPFDEGFAGWGWEDTDWGLRCERLFPVLHIDNTATHLGLDDAKTLMGKYARSGANFARLADRHPVEIGASPLMRASRLARRMPMRRFARVMLALLARDPLHITPIALRGRALKAWRAFIYAEQL